MPTQDEEIARHLAESLASGELSRVPGFGRPFEVDDGWEATPAEFRMPFKILKNAGYAPPEIELFHERAALTAELERCTEAARRTELSMKLGLLQQRIALRLEAMRVRGSV